jgi:CP family cyanate transporter-like MFS transporter
LGAVLPELRRDLALSATGAGLITTGPILCLSLFGMLAPAFARRYGLDRAVLISLLILTVATAARGFGSIVALSVGTFAAGCSIGCMNVYLPAIVKRDFSNSATLLTGLVTMALCSGGALASALTLPLARLMHGHWSYALASWAILGVPAVLLWTQRECNQTSIAPNRRIALQLSGSGDPGWLGRSRSIWAFSPRCPLLSSDGWRPYCEIAVWTASTPRY